MSLGWGFSENPNCYYGDHDIIYPSEKENYNHDVFDGVCRHCGTEFQPVPEYDGIT